MNTQIIEEQIARIKSRVRECYQELHDKQIITQEEANNGKLDDLPNKIENLYTIINYGTLANSTSYIQNGLVTFIDWEQNAGVRSKSIYTTDWINIHNHDQNNGILTEQCSNMECVNIPFRVDGGESIISTKNWTIEIVGEITTQLDKVNNAILLGGRNLKNYASEMYITNNKQNLRLRYAGSQIDVKNVNMSAGVKMTYTFTLSDTTLNFYKSGSKTTSATVSSSTCTSTYLNFLCDYEKSSTTIFPLDIYCVRLYNRALTDDDIDDNAQLDMEYFNTQQSNDMYIPN